MGSHDSSESTRAHLLATLGALEGFARRLQSSGAPAGGLARVRMMLDSRSLLAEELEWADERAKTVEAAEADVLTGYRLFVVKALVLAEHNLSRYPEEDLVAAAAAGEAFSTLLTLRRDIEALGD